MDFKIIIEQDEDGWYIVSVPALPDCISQGKNEEEARENISEAIELHLTALARDGIPLIPDQKRTESFVSVHV
jgi:predicted RNase H-like HicB family nuclease